MTDEKWLTKKMRERFTRIKLRSFEHCRIPSVPDLMAMFAGETFWLEGKAMPLVTSPIPFNGGQTKWIRELEDDGGKVFIICLLTSTRMVAVFRSPDILVSSPVDLVNPRWTDVLESLLIESL